MNNKDLANTVRQYSEGLISSIEFLIKVQVSQQALANLLVATKLPSAAQAKIDIADLMMSDDEEIEVQRKQPQIAADYVALRILHNLNLGLSVAEAGFQFYCTPTDDIGIKAVDAVLIELNEALIAAGELESNLDNGILWIDRAVFIDTFGIIPTGFAPIFYPSTSKTE